MKFSLAICSILVTGALAAIPVPHGTKGAAVSILNSNDTRVYHQIDNEIDTAIKEISVGPPTDTPRADNVIFRGPTRRNTPLAAVSWTKGEKDVQVGR